MRVAVVAVLVLLVVPGAAAWTQMRGEADRSTAIEPPTGTLDVAAAFRIGTEQQEILGRDTPYAVWVEGELASVVTGTGNRQTTCFLMHGQPGALVPVSLEGCEHGRLQGHVEDPGLFIVCMTMADRTGVLAAYKWDGQRAWAFDPREHFPVVAPQTQDATGGDWQWSCEGSAITEDAVVVPFLATRSGADAAHHRIAKVPLSGGEPLWGASVATQQALPLGGLVPGELQGDTANPDFLPLTVSVVPAGVFVSGLIQCAETAACRSPVGGAGYMGAVAWLDADGQVQSLDVPRPRATPDAEEDEPVRPIPVVSRVAAGQQNQFVALVGGRALFIDPTTDDVVSAAPVEATESEADMAFWPGPLWQSQRVAVPTDREIAFLSPANHREVQLPWQAPSPGDHHRIVDLAGDRLDRLFILTARLNGNTATGASAGDEATMTMLDREAREIHSLPLRATTWVGSDEIHTTQTFEQAQLGWLRAPRFVALGDALAVVDAVGNAFVLADRVAEPPLQVSDLFPAPDDSFSVTVDAVGQPHQVTVRWGDNAPTERLDWPPNATSMELTHLYSTPGSFEMVVTVLDEDGTTLSASRTVNVGGTPPPDLNLLQRWFSGDSRDTTWGIIGLAIALLGALYGYVRIRRSRGRMMKAIRRLHRIRDGAEEDPVVALMDLQELRQDVHDRAAAAYYDQAQFHILETRIANTARTILFQGIAGFRDRLTPAYQGLLASFFEDGRIGPQEAVSVMAGLKDQKRLGDEERERLQSMVNVLRV